MSSKNWFEQLWSRDGTTKAIALGIAGNLFSTALIYLADKIYPNIGKHLEIPVWFFIWLVSAAQLLALGIWVVLRIRSPQAEITQSEHHTDDAKADGGEAYIFMKVRPKHSEDIGKALSSMRGVRFASAIWGQWDVIVHVQAGTARDLIIFLNDIQKLEHVLSTETHIVRGDQSKSYKIKDEGNYAFLLLTLRANKTTKVLEQLEGIDQSRGVGQNNGVARIQHAAGILGQYDIALTVRYAYEDELRKLVMQYAQKTLAAETTTMPSIHGMTYIDGKAISDR